jgi:hypothetical protein
VIWVRPETKYFCKSGWTGTSRNSPSGKSPPRLRSQHHARRAQRWSDHQCPQGKAEDIFSQRYCAFFNPEPTFVEMWLVKAESRAKE